MENYLLLGLNLQAWLTIIVVVTMFTLLMKTKIPTDIVFLGGMAVLVLTGCLSVTDAISGFSSETVVVVGTLFVVIAGLDATGVLQWVVKHLLGQPSSYTKAMLRLTLPVALLSAFLSNATVVALFIKVVKMWAKKLQIAPSKLLIPLSYASCLGGVCTLIGTPPNLIVSGFYADHLADFGADAEPMNVFTTTLPGVFCLLVGIVSLIAMQKLLPSRVSPEDTAAQGNSNTTELTVPSHSHLVGQTLQECHLWQDLNGNGHLLPENAPTLLGIVRYDGVVVNDIQSDEFLMGHDTLVLSGDKSLILEIAKRYSLECALIDKEIKTSYKTLLSSLIMIAMVVLSALEIMPLLMSAFLAGLLMFVTRCCNSRQIHQAINWDVLMVFATSVCLGKAIDQTGIAQMMTENLVGICGSNAFLALCILGFFGTFLTEFISNTACGAMLAPIAIKLALTMDANPLTFCIVLMIACSSSFATPIGSPTHLLVYIPGGYRFTDFVRIGLPMNVIILAANIFICCLLFPL